MKDLFINTLFTDPWYFFMILVVVTFSVCLHEYFHARVALWMGDSTAADQGHLTLNPLRQMGITSLLMLLFLGLAWGAVPVDRSRFRSKWGDMLTSLAGPVTNLGLAVIAWILLFLLALLFPGGLQPDVFLLLVTFGVYNVALFLLNIIPIPGLDGWNVLLCFFPGLTRRIHSEWMMGLMILLFLLVLTFARYLFFAGTLFMGTALLAARLLD